MAFWWNFTSLSADIYRSVRNYRDLEGKSWALNVHYEDVQRNYDDAMKRVFSHLGILDDIDEAELMAVRSRVGDVCSYPGIETAVSCELALIQNVKKLISDMVSCRLPGTFDLRSMPVGMRDQYKVDIHVTEGSFNKEEIRMKVMRNKEFRMAFKRLARILGYEEHPGAVAAH